MDDAERAGPALFADLYHQRWRIEETFRRLKHRLHLVAVSRLSLPALHISEACQSIPLNQGIGFMPKRVFGWSIS